ncbi:MAG: hypothetical protein Q9181_007707 [Wetmoreana brouardii]
MGGFALASSNDAFLPNGLTRSTLTPSGLQFLLRHEPDALPDISAEQIKDKSKADGLKKTVVCIQALWFCIQCVTRLSQSLPVSLLEINTVGHALCTLVIYLLWWHKPLDVEEPTLLTDPGLYPIFAYMWMTSRISAKGAVGYDIGGKLRDEFDCIWPFENPVLGDLILKERTPEASDPSTFVSVSPWPPAHDEKKVSMMFREDLAPTPGRWEYTHRSYPSVAYRFLHMLVTSKLLPKRVLRSCPGIFVRKTAVNHLTCCDLERWKLAHTAIERYELELDLRWRHATYLDGRNLRSRISLRQRNVIFTFDIKQLAVTGTLSGALYGGLHLVAWNATFPSRIEQALWRASAVCVACNGLQLGLGARVLSLRAAKQALHEITTMSRPSHSRPAFTKEFYKNNAKLFVNVLWALLFMLSMLVLPILSFSYILARIFLVVESFRDLAFLPSGAFETPTWPAYLPHIT